MEHVKDDLQVRWLKLRIKLKERFGIKPDMDGILFLIGIQELGSGKQDFSKEEKRWKIYAAFELKHEILVRSAVNWDRSSRQAANRSDE